MYKKNIKYIIIMRNYLQYFILSTTIPISLYSIYLTNNLRDEISLKINNLKEDINKKNNDLLKKYNDLKYPSIYEAKKYKYGTNDIQILKDIKNERMTELLKKYNNDYSKFKFVRSCNCGKHMIIDGGALSYLIQIYPNCSVCGTNLKTIYEKE